MAPAAIQFWITRLKRGAAVWEHEVVVVSKIARNKETVGRYSAAGPESAPKDRRVCRKAVENCCVGMD
eukprot:scaffold3805_cov162-Chaetoceros_neogracile.AAC.1